MAFWTFSYNVPLVLVNFMYLIFAAALAVVVVFGWITAKKVKQMEQYVPASPEFEAKKAEREAAKAAKKGEKTA